MSGTDWHLIDAIEDALAPALEDAGHEALVAAMCGGELPTNPTVLQRAFTEAAELLGVAWGKIASDISLLVAEGDLTQLEEAQHSWEGTRALSAGAEVLLARLLQCAGRANGEAVS